MLSRPKANNFIEEEIRRSRKRVSFIMNRFGYLEEMPGLESRVGENRNNGYILLEIFDIIAKIFCDFDRKRCQLFDDMIVAQGNDIFVHEFCLSRDEV